jgi:hypothetical protein
MDRANHMKNYTRHHRRITITLPPEVLAAMKARADREHGGYITRLICALWKESEEKSEKSELHI